MRTTIPALFMLMLFVQGAFASPAPILGTELFSNAPKTIDLSKATRATVIIFVSAKCPCSGSHEPVLRALHEKFSKRGFEFVAVHSNEDEDLASTAAHFRLSKFPFPILQDSNATLANRFGALKTPHVYVVNPEGEVLYEGGVDDSHDTAAAKKFYLNDALEKIAEGKSPDAKKTRVLGCIISRKSE